MIAKQMQDNKKGFRAGRGSTFALNIEFNDSNNAPVNLTGHQVRLDVYSLKGVSVGTYPAVLSTGSIAIEVTDEQTALWPLGKLAYRVVHTEPMGREFWLIYGPLSVESGLDV